MAELRKEIEKWLLGLSGLLSIALGLFLIVAPGAGILTLLWWVGATAIVFGALTIILGFRLKGIKGWRSSSMQPVAGRPTTSGQRQGHTLDRLLGAPGGSASYSTPICLRKPTWS